MSDDTPKCKYCGLPIRKPDQECATGRGLQDSTCRPMVIDAEFERGYAKGAEECRGIVDKMDALQAENFKMRLLLFNLGYKFNKVTREWIPPNA